MGSQTERMRITDDGNVGIGTSSPTASLNVGNTGMPLGTNNPMFIVSQNVDAEDVAVLRGQSGGYTGTVLRLRADGTTGGDFLRIEEGTTSITTHMIVDDAGQVGIGTDSPSSTLHVKTDTGVTIKTAGTNNTPSSTKINK